MCLVQNQNTRSLIPGYEKAIGISINLILALLFSSHSEAQENAILSELSDSFSPLVQIVDTLQSCGAIKPVCIQPQDEVWLIDARESHLAPCDVSLQRCAQLQNGKWIDTDLSELVCRHRDDKSKQTMIYVHGNRTELKWAQSRGLQFYENAMQCERRPPVRFVIYAWKSEAEITRLFPDFQIKSDRSLVVGTAFGKLLNEFSDRQLVLGGFSLGAQVVLKGVANEELHDGRPGKFRVAIFAPALNPNYTASELSHFASCPNVERTEVFKNRDDRAVKLSQLINRKRAKSYVYTLSQLAMTLGRSNNRIRIVDITTEVTKKHSIVKYSKSPLLVQKLGNMLCEQFATVMPTQSAPTLSESRPPTAPSSATATSTYVGKIEFGPMPVKLSSN